MWVKVRGGWASDGCVLVVGCGAGSGLGSIKVVDGVIAWSRQMLLVEKS